MRTNKDKKIKSLEVDVKTLEETLRLQSNTLSKTKRELCLVQTKVHISECRLEAKDTELKLLQAENENLKADRGLQAVYTTLWFDGQDDVAGLKSENRNIRKELFDKKEEISKLKHAMWQQSHDSTERSTELGKQILNLQVQLEEKERARSYWKAQADEMEAELEELRDPDTVKLSVEAHVKGCMDRHNLRVQVEELEERLRNAKHYEYAYNQMKENIKRDTIAKCYGWTPPPGRPIFYPS